MFRIAFLLPNCLNRTIWGCYIKAIYRFCCSTFPLHKSLIYDIKCLIDCVTCPFMRLHVTWLQGYLQIIYACCVQIFLLLYCCYDVIESTCLCAHNFLHDFVYVILSLLFVITSTSLSILEKKITNIFIHALFNNQLKLSVKLELFFHVLSIIFEASFAVISWNFFPKPSFVNIDFL